MEGGIFEKRDVRNGHFLLFLSFPAKILSDVDALDNDSPLCVLSVSSYSRMSSVSEIFAEILLGSTSESLSTSFLNVSILHVCYLNLRLTFLGLVGPVLLLVLSLFQQVCHIIWFAPSFPSVQSWMNIS